MIPLPDSNTPGPWGLAFPDKPETYTGENIMLRNLLDQVAILDKKIELYQKNVFELRHEIRLSNADIQIENARIDKLIRDSRPGPFFKALTSPKLLFIFGAMNLVIIVMKTRSVAIGILLCSVPVSLHYLYPKRTTHQDLLIRTFVSSLFASAAFMAMVFLD